MMIALGSEWFQMVSTGRIHKLLKHVPDPLIFVIFGLKQKLVLCQELLNVFLKR